MTVIQAKILDSTHLELSRPISSKRGEAILVSIPDENEEYPAWRDASMRHFMMAYSDEDAIYDRL